jgi:hypothetical protein
MTVSNKTATTTSSLLDLLSQVRVNIIMILPSFPPNNGASLAQKSPPARHIFFRGSL